MKSLLAGSVMFPKFGPLSLKVLYDRRSWLRTGYIQTALWGFGGGGDGKHGPSVITSILWAGDAGYFIYGRVIYMTGLGDGFNFPLGYLILHLDKLSEGLSMPESHVS